MIFHSYKATIRMNFGDLIIIQVFLLLFLTHDQVGWRNYIEISGFLDGVLIFGRKHFVETKGIEVQGSLSPKALCTEYQRTFGVLEVLLIT